MRTWIIAMALCLVSLGACARKPATARYELRKTTFDAAAHAPEAVFSPSSWHLTELRGRRLEPGVEGQVAPYLVFEREQSRVHGVAGCNKFAGSFEFGEGNRLRFSKLASTLMACPDMEVEAGFLEVLETTDSYFLEGGVLVLHRARMAPLARFEAARD